METKLFSLGEIEDSRLDFAVIGASYRGKWLFVRHKDRDTWEIPGGHREEKETIDRTAARELLEETGVENCQIEPVCDYSVTRDGESSYGRLFYAHVQEMGVLPESEIGEVQLFKKMPASLTYPKIQPFLQQKLLEHSKEKVLHLLEKDRIRNCNIINFIQSYSLHTADRVGESVLIRGSSDEDWVYISSASSGEFMQLLQGLDEADRCFAVLEDWMLPDIVKGQEIRSRLSCMKLVFDPGTPLPPGKYPAVELSSSDAPYIYRNSKYQEYTSIEYIADRITHGTGLGIYEGDQLAAWAITHDDNAIGFLHVLEEYRGKGYGKSITVAMVKKLLEAGDIPFLHIEEENANSMELAMKAGFRKDRPVHWIKLR